MAIVIRRTDGSISVMTLLGDAKEAADLAPDHIDTIVDAEIAQWPKEDRDTVVDWRLVGEDDIPADKSLWAEVLT